MSAARHPEDLVIVAPRWAEPVARQVLGDHVMPLRDVARPDESRYATALEISILGQRDLATRTWSELERRTVGKFELRRLGNPDPAHVGYDFVDHLEPGSASVSLVDGAPKDCPWNAKAAPFAGGLGGAPAFPSTRFVCPAAMHLFAGVTVVEDQEYRPRRCVMMHAPDRGYVQAVFRNVPLGKEIRGHTGLRWIIERDLNGAPMTLEVLVGGEKLGDDVHLDGQGWKFWRFALGKHAGLREDVTFRVSSPSASRRQMCWEADSR